MQGKFRFSLDGVDATARQFAEIRRQLGESKASVGRSVSGLSRRVSDIEKGFEALGLKQDPSDDGESNAGIVPPRGETGVPTGVDYPKLSVAALRLAQEAMSEVDGLKAEVARLSSVVGKMDVSTSE